MVAGMVRFFAEHFELERGDAYVSSCGWTSSLVRAQRVVRTLSLVGAHPCHGKVDGGPN